MDYDPRRHVEMLTGMYGLEHPADRASAYRSVMDMPEDLYRLHEARVNALFEAR